MARPIRIAIWPLCALAIVACTDPPRTIDGGIDARSPDVDASTIDASTIDAPTLDASTIDATTIDAGACAPGEVATWDCVQGDLETHSCTDTMVPPQCVDGRWRCSGDALPDWYVDCWCHVGPWPWPDYVSLCACTEADGWTCEFHCGPALLCTAYDEYCARTPSDVGGEPDSYACRAFEPCSVQDCDCVAAGSISCEAVENGGVVATYPGG